VRARFRVPNGRYCALRKAYLPTLVVSGAAAGMHETAATIALPDHSFEHFACNQNAIALVVFGSLTEA
jgi:hypothetical protein